MDDQPANQILDRTLGRRTFVLAGGVAAFAAACTTRAVDNATTTEASTTPTTTERATGDTSQPDTSQPATTQPATTATPGVTDVGTTTVPTTIADTAAANSTLDGADFEALGTCILLSEKTAGPFPLDEQFDRRDITEGYPGHPLRLGLRVVDAACAPLPGAVVEIWHTDATGDYSAYTDGGGGKDEGAGTTFLRGSQAATADGIVEFMSLYPGWYRGRAVHIHLRIHIDDTTVLTSQLFFDDAYTAQLFMTGEYAAHGQPDTVNSTDSIAGNPAAEGSLLHLAPAETANGPGTLALLNLGIDPTATSNGVGGGGNSGPPPGSGG